jgi:hypothetical protein
MTEMCKCVPELNLGVFDVIYSVKTCRHESKRHTIYVGYPNNLIPSQSERAFVWRFNDAGDSKSVLRRKSSYEVSDILPGLIPILEILD